MNQHDFAVAIGVPDGSLANWETDRAKPRDIVAVAKRIELLTRIPAGWTLGIEDSPDRMLDSARGTVLGYAPCQSILHFLQNSSALERPQR